MSKRHVSRRAVLLLVTVCLIVLTSVLVGGCKPTATPSSQQPIAYAPSPLLGLLKSQGLDGQVALVEFGIIPCKMTGDALEDMIRMNKEKTVPHLSYLRVDASPSRDQAQQYFQGNAIGFPVVYDDKDSVSKAFGATTIPTTILVDEFGRVRYRGNFPAELKLKNWVHELYEQNADSGPDVTLFGIVSADLAGLPAATKLPDFAGTVASLQSYAGNKGLLMVFADVSCPYAKSALGDLPKVAPTMAKYGISTVVVNISDAKADVLKTYADRQTGTPVVYDVTDATKENWKIDRVPTVVLFGADGKAAYRAGAIWKDLATATEKQLALTAGSIVFEPEGTGMG